MIIIIIIIIINNNYDHNHNHNHNNNVSCAMHHVSYNVLFWKNFGDFENFLPISI